MSFFDLLPRDRMGNPSGHQFVAGHHIRAGSAVYIRDDGKLYPQVRWEFPSSPFVEYEKSDEAWAIPLGFGRWVEVEHLSWRGAFINQLGGAMWRSLMMNEFPAD